MLKLIYSPYYDGNCYAGNPDKNKCVIGTKYVGSRGLLDELELRAGLSRGETSPMQRVIAYSNAIREVLADNPPTEPFYKQSFENDPLGVAQQLLRWRDALCMAGWNKETNIPDTLSEDGKKRLKDLQAVEKYFDSIGIGERWQILLAEAKNRSILPADVSIVVNMKMELLPPVIRNVLEEIKNNGGNVSESQNVAVVDKKSLSDFTQKFTLYEFPDQVDAYQWAATQAEFTPDVYINEDNFTLNQVLKSVGKPLVSASVDGGATDLLQLLKLGMSLFRNPVNYTTLMSYLSIFRHPIVWETRSRLRYHLKKTGGFGDYTEDGQVIKIDVTANNYPDFWGMWEHGKNGMVAVDKVKKFCKEIQKWAETAAKKAEAERIMSPMTGTQVYSQFVLLQEKSKLMLAFLDGKTGDIGNDELDKAVSIICQSGSVSTDFARLGSSDILSDLKGLATDVNTVIWMDCVRKPRPRYEYAFLNPADIKGLQAIGLLIPDASLEMRASDFAEKLAVSRAEKIIALMPQRKDGERTDENLIITELRETSSTTITITSPDLPAGVTITTTPADTQKVEHKVDKALFANIDKPRPKPTDEETVVSTPSKFTPKPVGYQRDYESFSSLSELINQPFDYVLDYIYNMKDEDSGNLSMVEGNVAHAVIDQMVEECTDKGNVDTSKFLTLCKDVKKLEERTDQAIHDVGAVLLQPENEMECHIFKRIFIEKSIPVLAKIIEENALEIVGTEVEYTSILKDSSNKDAFNFNAKIDCLLKRTNPETNELEYLIFDFKWTGSPNKREKELNECKELQLALYQKIAEVNGLNPIVMRGYYLLKQAQLLTIYDVFKPNNSIKILEQNNSYDIFEQAVASYRERINNLKDGKDGYIEEGEEMKGGLFEPTQFIAKCLADFVKNNQNSGYFLNNKLEMSKKSLGHMNSTTKATSNGKNIVLKGKIK